MVHWSAQTTVCWWAWYGWLSEADFDWVQSVFSSSPRGTMSSRRSGPDSYRVMRPREEKTQVAGTRKE